ncbi:MAG TPA: hypothetical protein VMB50_03005 [Myxococcales bacterium]|nr:hypothetical protein [Myxococcales bacterium]
MPMATEGVEAFWRILAEGELGALSSLLAPDPAWDDPLFEGARGSAVAATALPRFAAWVQERRAEGAIEHVRTTADSHRLAVESLIPVKHALGWNQALQRSERVARGLLPVAVVADLAGTSAIAALRIYFSTWVVLDGACRLRAGPLCPGERSSTEHALSAFPVVRRYFDCLARGDAAIAGTFEPDGYFREPANNFASGPQQLGEHFQHILKLGGVGLEFLTGIVQDRRVALELQTVVWGPKRMPVPQAGFASYDIGPHGKVHGARVYDSVVPPEL